MSKMVQVRPYGVYLKSTRKGLSATMPTDQQVMVAYVAVHGVRIIYAAIGDLFAWLCIVGLIILTGLVLVQSKKR